MSLPSLVQMRYAVGVERSWWSAFERIVHSVPGCDPIARQLAHFCAFIRGEFAPRVTLSDALANLAVTEAVLAAAANGTTVQLP